VLRLFRQTTTEHISSFFLPTPQHKIALDQEPLQESNQDLAKPRKNPRMREKCCPGKSITKLAQDLVAKNVASYKIMRIRRI
jgi:hypothetical protein